MSTDEIGDAVNRVRGSVHNVRNNPTKMRPDSRSGRPPKITEQAKRNLLRKARTGRYTARQIYSDLALNISLSRVRQIMSSDPNLRWAKMKKKPHMTPAHHAARLQWATSHVSWTQPQWDCVIWSDEKKFNLDGPDGRAYYWHDKRLPPKIFSKRHSGGGSIMIWGCYSSRGGGQLAVLDGRLTAIKYIEILENYLLPFAYVEHGTATEDFVFMQDGARAHTANITKQWLQGMGIEVMNWPACSPDLNPIENLWAILTLKVYPNSKQYSNVSQLKQAVFDAWESITDEDRKCLNQSMNNRCLATIQARGKATKY